MIKTICVCGAGTMGSGIALLCAQNTFSTILYDVNHEVLEKAKKSINDNLQFLVSKQKISLIEKGKIYNHIKFANTINDCIADVIIEAIAEKIELKIDLFNQLSVLNNEDIIFATNTSSLSISEMQKKILNPQRVVGMHFFNPPAIMKLVEVSKTELTFDAIAQSVYSLCIQLGKIPVMCKDSPGFIVNRIARHYYLEALKLAEDEKVSFKDIDSIMEATGFKMGPFKLMDLIGLDINLSVSQSIYEAFDKPVRFLPSAIQIEKIKNGELGKKTGEGFYTYS